MSQTFVNGSSFSVSRALSVPALISAISNARPPVALAAVTPAADDIVVISSDWTNLTDSVAKVGVVVANTSFEIDGYDTSNLQRFPVGQGAGSYQVASSFIGLSQVRTFDQSPSTQNFYEFGYIEDISGRTRRKPTNKSASEISMTLDYDPDLAWYAALIEIDAMRVPVVMRQLMPNGDTILYYGFLSFDKVPSSVVNENMTNAITFSSVCDPVRYAA